MLKLTTNESSGQNSGQAKRKSLKVKQPSDFLLVGVRGFEPPASWSRTKHSTKLSHTPKNNIYIKFCFFVRDRPEPSLPLRHSRFSASPSFACGLVAAASFRARFLCHRQRSRSNYQTEPHPEKAILKSACRKSALFIILLPSENVNSFLKNTCGTFLFGKRSLF